MARQISGNRKRKLNISLVRIIFINFLTSSACRNRRKVHSTSGICKFQRPWIELSSASEDEDEDFSHLFKRKNLDERSAGKNVRRPTGSGTEPRRPATSLSGPASVASRKTYIPVQHTASLLPPRTPPRPAAGGAPPQPISRYAPVSAPGGATPRPITRGASLLLPRTPTRPNQTSTGGGSAASPISTEDAPGSSDGASSQSQSIGIGKSKWLIMLKLKIIDH